MKFSLLILLLFLSIKVQAQTLSVGYGRLSLIDLGSLITAKPLVVNEQLARVYELSGLDMESDKSILAIQGLKDSGETDLTVDTEAGIKQFHLVLNAAETDDLLLVPKLARSNIVMQKYYLATERSSVVRMPAHINEYVLAGNPNLLNLKQVKDYYDAEFLKVFAFVTNTKAGETDVVIPTRKGVYKFTIEVGDDENLQHNDFIDINESGTRF